MSKVLLEKRDGYAVISLNRPEAMNALSRELRRDLVEAFEECNDDDGIRVVILTGNGKAFCAGFDLKELSSGDSDASEEADNSVARAMEAFPGPIIAAVNGHAITGGFELALACDIRIASENARFADTHAHVGILPGWGLSQKLPRLIGLSRAKEISFTGNPIFAPQACEWGLVNHVVPAEQLMPKAIQLAEDMCACVPEILQQYKQLIDQGYAMPYGEALAWEERQSIESAKKALASVIATRRDGVMEKGRNDTEKG
ncbi:MAG: enoyl-CoA hydratase [Deltaproteobacteria bacterium]|nr:enoyl-CoA hydratase [Deltaproteobacteria bacterium]